MQIKAQVKLLAVTMAMLLLTGCLGGATQSGGTAQIALYFTDTGQSLEPAVLGVEAAQIGEEITEVWVTITAVYAKHNKGWEKLFDIPADQGLVNLMDLRFQKELLGGNSIPAGKYTEIRFEVKENEGDHEAGWFNYVVVNGQKSPLKVPSTVLKVDMNITLTDGSIVELIFDVDSRFLVERGGDNGYIANPRKAMRFMKSYEIEYGGIMGEIELPAGIDSWLSIDVELVRSRDRHRMWSTKLEDNKLKFEIQGLPPGRYEFRVVVRLMDGTVAIEFETDPITVEAGQFAIPVRLRHKHP